MPVTHYARVIDMSYDENIVNFFFFLWVLYLVLDYEVKQLSHFNVELKFNQFKYNVFDSLIADIKMLISTYYLVLKIEPQVT